MLIFGLGLTKSHWKKIFQSIQIPLKPQIISARLLSPKEIEPQNIISTCQHLRKSPPVLTLMTPRGFETFTDCLFFLSQMQLNLASKKMYYGVIVENLVEDFHPFLAYSPQLKMANQEVVTLNDPNLVISKTSKSLSLDCGDIQQTRIEYCNAHGAIVNQSLNELPQGELVALNQIQQVSVGQKTYGVDEWLIDILQKQGKELLQKEMKGIFNHGKGMMSLSKGVSLDALESLQLGDLCLDFILSYQSLSMKNHSFKRMIKILHEQVNTPKREVSSEKIQEKKSFKCLGRAKIINQIVERILIQRGLTQVQIIDELAHGTHTLEDTLVWIQLSSFPNIELIGQKHDFVSAIKKIVKQSNQLVSIKKLKIHDRFSKSVLSQIEFEHHTKRLKQDEQKLQEHMKKLQRSLPILLQEKEELMICAEQASLLQQQLNDAKDLETFEHQGLETVILFATEYSQMGQKTVWIDLFEYTEPLDLRRLPKEQIQRNATSGILIAQQTAKEHLQKLCQQTQEQLQACQQSAESQQTELEVLQTNFEALIAEKNSIAVQWIDDSLQKLFQDAGIFD